MGWLKTASSLRELKIQYMNFKMMNNVYISVFYFL